MAARRTCRILCDTTDCPTCVDGVNATVARNRARDQGWLCRNSSDLCPAHRPQTREARIAVAGAS